MAAEVTVLAFGSAAEALGWKCRVCPLPLNATLQVLAREWANGIPAAAAWRYAVNERYVEIGQVLAAGDEVAIIPPVSGG